MSNDDTDDLKAYKRKNARELDALFRLNGFIQSQVMGENKYRNASCWCACGRLKSVGDLCSRCAEKAEK